MPCNFGDRVPTASLKTYRDQQRPDSGKKKKGRTIGEKMAAMLKRVHLSFVAGERAAAGRPPPKGPDVERFGHAEVFALIAEIAGRAGDPEFKLLWRELVEELEDDATDLEGSVGAKQMKKWVLAVFDLARKVEALHLPSSSTKLAQRLKRSRNKHGEAYDELQYAAARVVEVLKTHSEHSASAQAAHANTQLALRAYQAADRAHQAVLRECRESRERNASLDWQTLATMTKPDFDGGEDLLRDALCRHMKERDHNTLWALVNKPQNRVAKPLGVDALYAHYLDEGHEAVVARAQLGGRTLLDVFKGRTVGDRLDAAMLDPPTSLWMHLPDQRGELAFPAAAAVFANVYAHRYEREGLDVLAPDPDRAADDGEEEEARGEELREEHDVADAEAEEEEELAAEAPPMQDALEVSDDDDASDGEAETLHEQQLRAAVAGPTSVAPGPAPAPHRRAAAPPPARVNTPAKRAPAVLDNDAMRKHARPSDPTPAPSGGGSKRAQGAQGVLLWALGGRKKAKRGESSSSGAASSSSSAF